MSLSELPPWQISWPRPIRKTSIGKRSIQNLPRKALNFIHDARRVRGHPSRAGGPVHALPAHDLDQEHGGGQLLAVFHAILRIRLRVIFPILASAGL